MAKLNEIRVATSSARTATGNTSDFSDFGRVSKCAFYLDVTAVSGTAPTLDVVIQEKDPFVNQYYTAGTFTQKTAVGKERIVVNPLFGTKVRAQWTIGGTAPSFTFSISAVAHEDL